MAGLPDETRQTILEQEREQRRKERPITYDCFSALFPADGDNRVKCAKGIPISRTGDGGIDLTSVLRGRGGTGCINCAEYDDGGEHKKSRKSNKKIKAGDIN